MARPTSLYIPSYVSLGNHPKTRKLARGLGISKVQAVGHLHFLWWWATSYASDGDLSRVTNEDVAIGAEWDGDPDMFVQALCDAGFIDARLLHDWNEYGGEVIEKIEHKRQIDRERQRKYRMSRVTEPLVTRDNDVSHAHKKRKEKIREEESLSSEREGSGANASPRAPRKFRLPLDWVPSEANRDFARTRGMTDAEIDTEADKFRDHFTGINPEARPGWDASWRTWIQRALDRPRNNVRPLNGKRLNRDGSEYVDFAAMAAELKAQGR